MTFVPTTPPGPIAGSTPLVFSCAEPTNISLRFYPPAVDGVTPPGAWDVVYGGTDSTDHNGSFSDVYAGFASRAGNTWTIHPPLGVWPAPVRVWVDEGSHLDTLWSTLFELDLTTLANQTLTNSGVQYTTHTIGGVTWSLQKSSGVPNATISNGNGILVPTNDRQQSGNPYAGARLSVIASALAGFDSTKLVAVQTRFKRVNGSGLTTTNADVGVEAWADNGAPDWFAPQNSPSCCYLRGDAPGLDFWPGFSNNTHYDGQIGHYGSSPLFSIAASDFACSQIVWPGWSQRSCAAYYAAGLAALPVMESMTPLFCSRGPSGSGGLHLGAYFGSSTGTTTDYYLSNIRVLQKAIP